MQFKAKHPLETVTARLSAQDEPYWYVLSCFAVVFVHNNFYVSDKIMNITDVNLYFTRAHVLLKNQKTKSKTKQFGTCNSKHLTESAKIILNIFFWKTLIVIFTYLTISFVKSSILSLALRCKGKSFWLYFVINYNWQFVSSL